MVDVELIVVRLPLKLVVPVMRNDTPPAIVLVVVAVATLLLPLATMTWETLCGVAPLVIELMLTWRVLLIELAVRVVVLVVIELTVCTKPVALLSDSARVSASTLIGLITAAVSGVTCLVLMLSEPASISALASTNGVAESRLEVPE